MLGRLDGHPDGVQGLVMERISTDYRTLAGPPSFESCTRDVYPAACGCPASVALRIAAGRRAATN